MNDFDDVERLIRLKRYERPSEDFYERFFDEFQARQRSEMLRQSAHGLFFERVSTWMWGLGNRRWLYAGGAAYAAVMIVVFLTPMSQVLAPSNGPPSETKNMVVPGAPPMAEDAPAESKPVHDNALPPGAPQPDATREL